MKTDKRLATISTNAPKWIVGMASTWLAVAVLGCSYGDGKSSSSFGTTAASVTSNSSSAPQWQGPTVSSTVPGSEITDLEATSTEVLVASPPELDVVVLGVTTQRETGLSSPVESLASVSGQSYAGSGNEGVAGSGDVYERGNGGWQLVLDGDHEHAVVASLGNDLYAFEGTTGATPRVSVLSAGQWTSSSTLLPVDCVPSEAVAGNGVLWVGASSTQDDALLFVGDAASGFGEVVLPNAGLMAGEGERVSALALDAQGELLLALETFDLGSGQSLRGRLLRYTSLQTFDVVLSLASDAPLSLAVDGATIRVGTASGQLLSGDDSGFVPDAAAPSNQGVTRLLTLGSTLWIGVRTSQGAEVYSLDLAANAGGGTLGYSDIKPALMACVGCHSTMATGYTLSTGLGDDNADYTATLGQVDLATADQSSLLTKASGSVGHGGGSPWAIGSADYDLVLTWIQQGANQVSTAPPAANTGTASTPTTPTATVPTAGTVISYQVHMKPLLSSCVGCHTSQSTYRLSSGLSNDSTDYQATLTVVNKQLPDASPLLTKASGTSPHAGGAPWPTGSAAYQTTVLWIQGGAVFSGGTPAAPAPLSVNPTYLTDAKPVISTCVGCHSKLGDMRLSPSLTDDAADYRSVLDEVDLGTPANSGVLTRATRQKSHPVKVFDVGSRPYEILLNWIQKGAKFN